MFFNEEKFRNAVLFFLNHCNNAKLGKTKLLKLFYFLDFGFYQKYKRSLTGSTYVRYKYGPIPTEAERVFKQLQKEHQIASFQRTFHGKSQTRYEALAEFNFGIFGPDELDFMLAVARFFSPHTATEMTELAHSETPWRVTPQSEFISYELAAMRSLTYLEEVERLKEISSSLSADDIIRNTPGLLKEIKESTKDLSKTKYYSFEEVFG